MRLTLTRAQLALVDGSGLWAREPLLAGVLRGEYWWAIPSTLLSSSMNASAFEIPLIFAKKSMASPRSAVAWSIHRRPSSKTEKLGERSSRKGERHGLPGSPRRLNIRQRTGIVNLALASSIRVRGVTDVAAFIVNPLSDRWNNLAWLLPVRTCCEPKRGAETASADFRVRPRS